MTEHKYKGIFDEYLKGRITVGTFIDRFTDQWKLDRDGEIESDPRFQRLIDRIFTTCDCYNPTPEPPFEISEDQLKAEVALVHHIWFG